MVERNRKPRRSGHSMRDQWGRTWLVAGEANSGPAGCFRQLGGSVEPAGWSDPLGTPPAYITIQTQSSRGPARNRVYVDLVTWLARQRDGEQDWQAELWVRWSEHYVNAFNPMTAEQDEYLLRLVGPKPFPPVAAIQEALHGNRALLGLAPLTKHDRALLERPPRGRLGYAEAPSVPEPNRTPPSAAEQGPYASFVAKLERAGIADAGEIAKHWTVSRYEERSAQMRFGRGEGSPRLTVT